MIIPKNAGNGNTFTEIHIGHCENIFAVGAEAVEKFYINGNEVTKEEYENFNADDERKEYLLKQWRNKIY